MSVPCSIERCKQSASLFCDTCNKNYCNEHLKDHDEHLKTQLNPLIDEIKILSDRYIELNTKKLINDCQLKLNKWRDDCHDTINRLYKEKSEELDQNWTRILDKPKKDIDKMQIKLKEFIQKQKTTHEDIQQSISAIQYIDHQIKEIEQKGIEIFVHPLLIDKRFFTNKEFKLEDVNLFDFSSPYRTIDCYSQSGIAFAGNNQNLLIYEDHKLNLLNQDLISIKQTSWTNGNIYDMCWTSKLNKFIIITEKRIIYLINENPSLTFTRIESIPQENWWSCTCSDKYLFLSTYGTDANIYQFNLLSSFQLIKQWRSPLTCKQHEYIHHINYANQTLALIILDSKNKIFRIELRSSTTLAQLWTLSFDLHKNLYQPSIHSCLLKYDQWIIIVENTSQIFHIGHDGKLKTTYEYKQPVWNVGLFNSNILAIRTENNIDFYKI